jgi:hypothetical protein
MSFRQNMSSSFRTWANITRSLSSLLNYLLREEEKIRLGPGVHPDHGSWCFCSLGGGCSPPQRHFGKRIGPIPLRGRVALESLNCDVLPLPDYVVLHATACLGKALMASRARMIVFHICVTASAMIVVLIAGPQSRPFFSNRPIVVASTL